jgi:O-6-methylguanine DNA methyltransferase
MFTNCLPGTHSFETVIGRCSFTWTTKGINSFVLHSQVRSTGSAEAKIVANRIKQHLKGKSDQLLDIPIDYSGTPKFQVKVFKALRKIKSGTVVTYGDLAKKAGQPGAARAVGTAMAKNPIPMIIPCHRVLPKNSSKDTVKRLGNFSSDGGVLTKAKLLHAEGFVWNEEHAEGLKVLSKDKKLRKLIKEHGPYVPISTVHGSPYDVLFESIVHQQISMKAAMTVGKRLRDLTPGEKFPSPEEMQKLPDERIKMCGMSYQKAGFLKSLAQHVFDGSLQLNKLPKMIDEDAIKTLCKVKGIGQWTAEMYLMFHLGRLDVWPVQDLGLMHGVKLLDSLDEVPTVKQLKAMSSRWSPYRSMATWYLWRSV